MYPWLHIVSGYFSCRHNMWSIEVRVTRPQLPLGQVYSFFLIRCDFWPTATAACCYRNNTNLFVICRHSCSCKNLQWPHRLFSRITFDYFLSLYWRNLNVSIKSSFQVLLFSSFKIVPWQINLAVYLGIFKNVLAQSIWQYMLAFLHKQCFIKCY